VPPRKGHSSSFSQKRYVRLPNQQQAAAAEGTVRLNASQVRCTLIVAYHQVSKVAAEESRHEVTRIEQLTVEFEEDAAFDELHTLATKALIDKYQQNAGSYYLKVGRFRLVRDQTQSVAARGILERKDDWIESLSRKIQAFRGQNFQVDFHVDIDWEFSSLHIEQVPGVRYADTIRGAIDAKIRFNWEGRFYIPRKDLRQIMTEDTIKRLVLDDESLRSPEALRLNGGAQVDSDELATKIYNWAVCLLAWCVYSRLDLVILYHMVKQDKGDANLPLTIDDCPDSAYNPDFRAHAYHSGGFAAYQFVRNDKGLVEHQKLHDGAVVPILFDDKNPHCHLGKGSFGVVYKVRIDRDHHSFSDRDDEYFAFKKFRDLDAHVAANVEAESEVLAKLADAPHDNITTHLASWRQKESCYMLFRCADCNLRTYMTQNPSPKWTKANLLAIIPQMAGLADGLSHIHNLGPANLQPEDLGNSTRAGHRRSHQAGYHHDLKLGNILVTTNKDTGQLLFSISDFGSARIGQIFSGSERPSQFTKNPYPGDPVYGAPDVLLEGKNSRPYDMWSMGCILLELITWMVGIEGNDVQTFEKMRLRTPANAHGDHDTAFWYQENPREVHLKPVVRLKPAVVEQLQLLKKHCTHRGVFEVLVHETGKLLKIEPRERTDASHLSNAFKAIIVQLNHDLKDEDFYLRGPLDRAPLAAPPSPTASDGGLSRSPSIDERPVPARFSDTLSPDRRAHRRSTVGSGYQVAGQRSDVGHIRHNSTSGAPGRPGAIRTDIIQEWRQSVSFADADQQETGLTTPSISLSDYDGGEPERSKAVLFQGNETG
jgi:serine/threonine protein kinase